MPRLNFVKKARKDIYRNGKEVKADNKKGYKIDKSQPSDENDKLLVAKGEGYYWWQFAYSPKSISLTRPKQSQLTRSEFLQAYYGWQEAIETYEADDGLESNIENLASEIEELGTELQERLDNMPEHLQETSTAGELLTERIEECETLAQELNDIDIEEPSEEDVRSEVKDELNVEDIPDDELDEDVKSDVDQKVEEKMQELWETELEKVTEVSFNL